MRRRCGEPRKSRIDDVLDEAVVQGGMAMEQPVVERAIEEVERELHVRGGGDLAALDCAPEERARRLAAWLDEARTVLRREFRVGPGLGNQRRDHAPIRAGADAAEPRPGQR